MPQRELNTSYLQMKVLLPMVHHCQRDRYSPHNDVPQSSAYTQCDKAQDWNCEELLKRYLDVSGGGDFCIYIHQLYRVTSFDSPNLYHGKNRIHFFFHFIYDLKKVLPIVSVRILGSKSQLPQCE